MGKIKLRFPDNGRYRTINLDFVHFYDRHGKPGIWDEVLEMVVGRIGPSMVCKVMPAPERPHRDTPMARRDRLYRNVFFALLGTWFGLFLRQQL